MKQCIYRVFLMLGLALWLFSCTEASIIDPENMPGDGTHNGTGDIFSLAMRIPLPDDYMYTRSYEGVNRGSVAEVLIEGVRMVLYEGGVVKYSLDLNIQLEPDNDNIKVTGDDVYIWATDGKRILIQTRARTFERGNYEMLVLINPNDVIKAKTEKGDLFSELDAPFDTSDMYRYRTVGEGANSYKEAAYFLMLNSQGPVRLNAKYFYDTEEKAEINPAYISLERVAAKLECNYTGISDTRSTAVAPYGRFVMLLDYNNQSAAPWGDDYDIPEDCTQCPVHGCNGTFDRKTKKCSAKPYLHTYDGLGLVADRVRYMVATDLSWEADIVNKKSNWLRQLTYKAGGVVLEEQGHLDRENFYAEDPNFSGISGSGSSNLNANFNYISSNDLIPGAEGSTAKKLYPQLPGYKYYKYWSWDKGDTQPMYIPENTMSQSEQKRDVVTRVVFKAVLKREQFGESTTDQNPVSPAPIGDFFVFKGGSTEINDYKYNNYNRDNSTFFILRPEDVAIYASASTTEHIHIYLRDGILEAIQQFKTDNPDFDFSDWKNEGPAQSTNLSFYKNGEIYYEVPIEHFSVAEAGGAGKYGRFGVVRNNWYKLNVENIISIGAPVLPEPTSEFIEPATRSALPETKSSSNFLIRNQSIIF
ncbi:fimbria major subunit [Parabacteroides sp. PF5-9]|uniref:fimbria major subunit n=1 Tax=Parabacteroides sp. PF5-9 TaxID=1742404 RepID=UPI0024771BED|nr:fimbria major subunit [Parabacteroides sp. PF5-9]MDH6357198.1 hypothetical protein [Parabacteroides sp. PF5-9]